LPQYKTSDRRQTDRQTTHRAKGTTDSTISQQKLEMRGKVLRVVDNPTWQCISLANSSETNPITDRAMPSVAA